MINKLIKKLLPSGHKHLKNEPQSTAIFNLFLEDLKIGELIYDSATWKFSYSDDFKNHNSLQPIADFPDIQKIYVSDVLWPFFASRIPSLNRSRVKKLIEKEGIEETDLNLLRRFGRRTVVNPFILKELSY